VTLGLWHILALVCAAAVLCALAVLGGRRHLLIWGPGWLAGSARRCALRRAPVRSPRHLMFCLCDHFEPGWGRPGLAVERRRVDIWLDRYPVLARRFTDAAGRHPQHTFFYPAEEYRHEHLEKLARICADGWGEVEIHLHHDRATPAQMSAQIEEFKERLRSHGLLGADAAGRIRFAFIHGNWTLDNSGPKGAWCGINNELQVLRDLGCYADLTMPSAPSPTQTRKINSIYWAVDDPQRPKSHNRGVDIAAGETVQGDLLMIQGPLTLDWGARKKGFLPAVENGELSVSRRPCARRVRLWANQRIGVRGRPEWVFVKLHTHGCEERNMETLFGRPAGEMHGTLGSEFNDGRAWQLHYVTAREMYNIVMAAQAGNGGDPEEYRDFAIGPPPVRVARPDAAVKMESRP